MINNAKGLIALDIDGTITTDMQDIPQDVIAYLTHLHEQGWAFVFITGRTFDFGYRILKALPFHYFYAVQNGAILLDMPDKKILSKKYLDRSIISRLEKICAEEQTDFVVFAGYEYDNQCYYRPDHFSEELKNYMEARCRAFHETWTALESFDQLPMDEFPSTKSFGTLIPAQRLAQKMETELNLHVPVIKDPFSSDYYVIQATREDVNKGQVLCDLRKLFGFTGKTIAAGDDLNDISMFEQADIIIAMGTAPSMLKDMATIIAPSAEEQGIIVGLKQAIKYTYA
jgi:Cof subfamily protein (haloacid dehalogenase superfamily)